jgi:predicted nucleic acid-binding protein
MKAVSNTSPLIFAGKVPKILELIRSEYSILLIPKEVYEEAVENPLNSDRLDIRENALGIKKLVDCGFLSVVNLNAKYKKLSAKLKGNIGSGEAAAVALAVVD